MRSEVLPQATLISHTPPQGEFLSTFAIVMLTIWLRRRCSPESKPVPAGDDETSPS
jgi:hypothetical protein